MKILLIVSLFLVCDCGVLAQDIVRTVAGAPLQPGLQDGVSNAARFNDPAAIVADSAGNIFVADSRNHLIRRISSTGVVTTIKTSGEKFDTPSGIAISPQGLIVSDAGAHVIRRIGPDGSTVTIAGSIGQPGFEDGLGTAARFDTPLGVAVTTNGVIYIADCGNHTIRAISLDGTVSTIAGSPGAWGTTDGKATTARFNGPIGLALDSQGNLFASDSNNHTIRKITPTHDVTTFAGIPLQNGFVNGGRRVAKLFQPAELAFDHHDSLYVADSMNHAIRKISVDGSVSTVTGFSHSPGAVDGENGLAHLYNPYGVAFLPSGELAISDGYNQTIRSAVPPAVLDIVVGRALLFRWNSVIGMSYQIQSTDGLFQTWSDLSDPVEARDITSSVSLTPSNGQYVFRLIARPGY